MDWSPVFSEALQGAAWMPISIDNLMGIYRLFDANGRCLYVGKSTNVFHRVFEHMSDPWWYEVKRAEYLPFTESTQLGYLEQETIRLLKPKYNFAHNPAKSRRALYLNGSDSLLSTVTFCSCGSSVYVKGSGSGHVYICASYVSGVCTSRSMHGLDEYVGKLLIARSSFPVQAVARWGDMKLSQRRGVVSTFIRRIQLRPVGSGGWRRALTPEGVEVIWRE